MDMIRHYKSIYGELKSYEKRIRYLMDNPHWLTDGEWKESILRTILKRYLPESYTVGRGFVCNYENCTTQIDVLIYDNNYPVIFKDGDLVFVTPDSVRGIIEVKSNVTYNILSGAINKLTEITKIYKDIAEPFIGLFSYDCQNINHARVLELLTECADGDRRKVITHLSLGSSDFFRFWNISPVDDNVEHIWHSYKLENLAPAYFIYNLVSHISHETVKENYYTWFPRETKERRREQTISL